MKSILRLFLIVATAFALTACSAGDKMLKTTGKAPPSALNSAIYDGAAPNYRLGPGETIQIFVWRSPELSTTVPVRPDGRFSMPLIEDMQAAGKTPTELARDIEEQLKAFVQDPIVTVIARIDGAGDPRQQIKVLGQAVNPSSLPYRSGMTALDVIIAVGGLTEFADGNRAVLVRSEQGKRNSYRLRLDDLVRSGDISADRPILPGDTIIIPESWL